jgi:PST family polysaccharide transporter
MGAEAVGLFSRARGFVGMFVEFYGMPVNQVLFPVLAKLQDERERLLKAYRQAVAFSALLALPSAVGLAALAAPLVGILLGEQWREIVPLVRIMAPTVFFMIMAMPFVAIVRGIGEIKEAVLLTAAETIALIVGAVFLSPYGLAAVAVLTTVVSGAAFVAGNAILARKLKVPAGLLYRPMRAGAIYAAIVAAIWAALEMLTPLSTDTLIGSGAFSSLCAAAMGMIVLTAPRWFLGEDLLWLEELMTKGRYKLQMLAAARR